MDDSKEVKISAGDDIPKPKTKKFRPPRVNYPINKVSGFAFPGSSERSYMGLQVWGQRKGTGFNGVPLRELRPPVEIDLQVRSCPTSYTISEKHPHLRTGPSITIGRLPPKKKAACAEVRPAPNRYSLSASIGDGQSRVYGGSPAYTISQRLKERKVSTPGPADYNVKMKETWSACANYSFAQRSSVQRITFSIPKGTGLLPSDIVRARTAFPMPGPSDYTPNINCEARRRSSASHSVIGIRRQIVQSDNPSDLL
eukprot:Nk52_evm8s2356 gene=Nk52_evmTU8s2356